MEYDIPEQNPYTIHWPVKLFTREFFDSPLAYQLSNMIFSVTDRRIDRQRIKIIIHNMEAIGLLTKK